MRARRHRVLLLRRAVPVRERDAGAAHIPPGKCPHVPRMLQVGEAVVGSPVILLRMALTSWINHYWHEFSAWFGPAVML